MHRKWRWIGHTLRRDSNNWHGKTSLELCATGKVESWTAKKQLGEVHAARVGETRLLLRESKVLAKNRVHWSVQVYRMMLQSSRKENINITRVFTIVAFLGFD